MNLMDRRNFLKSSLVAGITASHFNLSIPKGKVTRKYKTVLIGAGWWGNNILREAMASGSSKIAGICDADRNYVNNTIKIVEQATGDKPSGYLDYREMLSDLKPEIAIIASPEHWHALQAIEALKAGCHIYLEKPIAHTINEGKAIVAAAGKYGKVIQVGLHRRTSPHCRQGIDLIRNGKIGKVKMIKACVYSATADTFIQPQEAVPGFLDWNMYLGPATYQPYAPSVHPRGFRRFLNFTNGVIGDWGVHWMDQILWWSEEKYPRKIYSKGGLVNPDCGYDSPDFQSATFEFESFLVNWEHRRLGGDLSEKHEVGTYFYGTEGIVHIGWQDGTTIYPIQPEKGIVGHIPHQMHLPDHQNIRELWQDFLLAIQNKKQTIAGIESSHRATTMSLLAMISYKTGRELSWNGDQEIIVRDEEASAMMKRDYRDPWIYPSIQ